MTSHSHSSITWVEGLGLSTAYRVSPRVKGLGFVGRVAGIVVVGNFMVWA